MSDSIFQEFIKKAPMMKEKWEVVQLFEEERQKFQEELRSYEQEIEQARAVLKKLRAEVMETKESLKDLQKRQKDKEQEMQQLKEELLSHRVKRDLLVLEKDKEFLQEDSHEPLPQPVSLVEIYLKDRSVAKARPAKRFFGEQLYRKYRVLLRENHMLKDKLFKLDLENSTLKVELRDIKTKDFLSENGYVEE
ncbi:nickel-binding protein Mua [Helicobacter mehlei]|nr:nickel-binding protein Mua [Helicobacter mehlei]